MSRAKAVSAELKHDVDVLFKIDTHLAYVSFASKYRVKIIQSQTLNTDERVRVSCLIYISNTLGQEFVPSQKQRATLAQAVIQDVVSTDIADAS